MATISFTDDLKIKKFLTPPEIGRGYILDFSNDSFQNFIGTVTGINIYEEGRYEDYGTSKANRLGCFFEKEPDHVIGKVLLELAKYQQTLSPRYHSSEVKPDEIIEIANKLIQGSIDKDIISAAEPLFANIQAEILGELEKAEFTIWIAVAWFTDPILFNALLAKKAQGLNVQIIIHDDDINDKSGLAYNELETYRIPLVGAHSMNKMHHKFCIIDFKTVIHGSYNWTKSARFNGETIQKTTGYGNAENFLREFMKWKLQVI